MAGVGTILAHAKPWGVPTETLQCKERTPEGHEVVLEHQSISDWKASRSGLVSDLQVWVLHLEAMGFQAI